MKGYKNKEEKVKIETKITRITKKIKKDIINFIEQSAFYANGYQYTCGGYAIVKKIKLALTEEGGIEATGCMVSGKDDCGDGHSEKYTNEFDVIIERWYNKNKQMAYRVKRNLMEEA